MTPIVDMLREAAIWARDAELANDRIDIIEIYVRDFGCVVTAERDRGSPRRQVRSTLSERNYSRYVYVYRRDGRLLIHEVCVQFDVPGMKHGGCQYRIDDKRWREATVEEKGPDAPGIWAVRQRRHHLPISERQRETEVSVANGDLDVWNAWQNAKLNCAD